MTNNIASVTPPNTLDRLEAWFRGMCNGDWEHTYGIDIESADNPGWMVKIELRETPLFEAHFSPVIERVSESDWLHCEVRDGTFFGSGGIGKLDEILSIFLNWAEQLDGVS